MMIYAAWTRLAEGCRRKGSTTGGDVMVMRQATRSHSVVRRPYCSLPEPHAARRAHALCALCVQGVRSLRD